MGVGGWDWSLSGPGSWHLGKTELVAGAARQKVKGKNGDCLWQWEAVSEETEGRPREGGGAYSCPLPDTNGKAK